jgi:PAS domain S-box-containing protein
MWPPSLPTNLEEGLAMLAALAGASAGLESDIPTASPAPNGSAGPADSEAAEQSRRLAEARYRTLIEQIPAVTFLASLAGGQNEIYVSPQIESLLGFTQQEWVSDPVLWYRQTHPDDRERVSFEFAGLCLTGEPFREVVRVVTRAGDTVWVHAEARLVRDQHGQLLFLQGVGFDVTEQYRAREAREQLIREQAARAEADRERDRLREIFTGLPAAITLLRGPEHVIEFMNPVAFELAGVGADAIGKPFRDVFRQFAESGVLFDSVLTSGQPYSAHELRIGGSDGNDERFFNFICQPLQDYRGTFLLTHAVEVTEQVRARQAVEDALHMREEFLSIASHELKTPISALGGQAQLVLRRYARTAQLDPEQVTRALESIVGQAGKLARLIAQLLDISRIEAAKLIIEPEPTDLVQLVEDAAGRTRAMSEHHPITVRAPRRLEADVDSLRLEQVLTNLLDNAVKYSPGGGPIEVDVAQTTDGFAEISVADRGLGIPPEKRGQIFERFYQAHTGAHRGGLGLGLYISHQIVAQHGGELAAEFPADGGTRFVVRLPLHAKSA